MSTTRHWTTYLFYAFLALLVWVPMPLASGPQWSVSFFNTLTALLSLCTMTGFWRTRSPLPPALRMARWPLIAWAIYCSWLLFQNTTGISINRFQSQQQLLLTLSYVQLFVLTLLLVDTRDRVRIVFYVLVVCGVFQALYGGLMALSGAEKIWWIEKTQHHGFATGTFRNRNQLANYLVMCLAMGCGLLIASQGSRPINTWRQFFRSLVEWLLSGSGWLRLLLASIVIGIVLTHSRMGNTSLFVSLTVVGCIWLFRTSSSWSRALLLIGSLLMVDTLIVGAWFGLDQVVDRIQETKIKHTSAWLEDEVISVENLMIEKDQRTLSDNTTSNKVTKESDIVPEKTDKPDELAGQSLVEIENPSNGVRQPVASVEKKPTMNEQQSSVVLPSNTQKKHANELRDDALPQVIQMAKDNAVYGIGLGNFSNGFTAYNPLKIRLFYNEAHCDYLQFVIEVGIAGTGLLAFIVLYCGGCGFITLWSCRSRLLQGVGFAVSMVTVASLLHAWVEFNFQNTATSVVFVVVMAIGIVSRSLQDKTSEHGKKSAFSRGVA